MTSFQITSNGPIVLIVLDGWGIAPEGPGNAITLAKTPNFKTYFLGYPHGQLLASGEAVGLPHGEEGNSETGHLNLGAGRVVYQPLPRINLSIADGSFFRKEAFLKAIFHVNKYNSNLHLMGLIGAGGVHSSIEHLFALLRLMKDQNLKNVYLHLFTDGRDSPPTSSLIYISQIEEELKLLGIGKIASVSGRYYAMDRDFRWERVQKTYEAMTSGLGEKSSGVTELIKKSHEKGITDEFILPTIITNGKGELNKLISDNDAVIFFNFRIDRPRELTKAFVLNDFERYCPKNVSFDPYAERYGHKQFELPGSCETFLRKRILKNLFFVTMTQYEDGLPVEVAFPPPKISLSVSRLLSDVGIRQFHIAETEKYPHVTTFFNGLVERPFPTEEWAEVPSPKVATYDLKPEMSAFEVTEQFSKRFRTGHYRFAFINFANPDMVGHTGVIPAAVKACEVTDECLGKVVKETLSVDGSVVVTADHGNVEEMINLETGVIDTEHSDNPVPFVIINKALEKKGITLEQGILSDIAPTILSLAKIAVPNEMTGRNLLG